MSIIKTIKEIDREVIDCAGTVKLTLGITAEPDIISNPADIVLILDTSNYGCAVPLADLKSAAKDFIADIAANTGGDRDKYIGNGTRVGLVTFTETAVIEKELTTSVEELNHKIDNITLGRGANYQDAFLKADSLFEASSLNDKIIVMFTDATNINDPRADKTAEDIKGMGREIYCMGIIRMDNPTLRRWCSNPDSKYLTIVDSAAELNALFNITADKISKQFSTGIVINDTFNSDFVITGISSPTKGKAEMTGNTSIRWQIDELGRLGEETATLEISLRHISEKGGIKSVNQHIDYTDNEGNSPVFPSPSVMVNCEIDNNPEPCPAPVDITMEACQDSAVVDLNNINLQSMGRILEVNVRLKNVCPDKRVAMAVILTEVDQCGREYSRGMKTFTIPKHDSPQCRSIDVKCIKFVLPEDLNISGGDNVSICSPRHFRARVIAHYIDTAYTCCDIISEM